MTATFGKLDGQTLQLRPGINVFTAPNEWGKSTWCAFLCAMLYGIDTRERTRGENLADKEKFLPWSGKPMEGTVRLIHEGRDGTSPSSAGPGAGSPWGTSWPGRPRPAGPSGSLPPKTAVRCCWGWTGMSSCAPASCGFPTCR